MIGKYYQITCDFCNGCRCYEAPNKRAALKQWRADGGIVTKGMHFCSWQDERAYKQSAKTDKNK